jgi:FtsH-binding integral membrane protein
MEKINNLNYVHSDSSIAKAQSEFMTKVHAWMFGGLLATSLTAWYSVNSGITSGLIGTMWFWILIIAQFGFVIALSGWIQKMSFQIAVLSFLSYSVLTGLTLSTIFLAYSSESIYQTFVITAGMFAGLSAYGYFTKKNLSGMGSFLIMGLFGVIIMGIVNIFIASSAMSFIINIVGIIVFAGLTAYDTQRIKEMYILQEQGNEFASKGAIMGALTLYLDFINLFLFLLRFLGNRD